jgi:TatD DNase family protein
MCGNPDLVVQEASKMGIRYILTVGCDVPSSEEASSLAKLHGGVYACVGVHPHEATSVDDKAIATLAGLAKSPKTIAIGETGLDFYRNRSPVNDQVASFINHIELAREMGLPLVVHTREASRETLDLLEKWADGLVIIMHCFSLYDHVEECARRRYFMSVAGNVTFKNAHDLRKAVTKIPQDLLLTETDSPYLSPVPFRGKQNHPGNVRFVLNELAALRGDSTDRLSAEVLKNFQAAFGI